MGKENGTDKGHFEHQGQEYGHVHQVQEHEQHNHERIDHSKEHVKQAGQQGQQQGAQHQHQAPNMKADENDTTIFIDHKAYHIKDPRISAADIRKLSVPPIGDDKDIFHVVAGAENVKMSDTDAIDVNMHEKKHGHGRHFVSAIKPSAIAPQQDEKARSGSASATSKTSSSGAASRQDELAKKAYFIYLKRGSQHGYDVNDWLEAEAQSKKQNA